MKIFSRFLTPLIVGVLMLGFSGVNAQSSAPFLYYYSPAQSTFIVERADGSDSRVLANFEITPAQPDQEVHPIIVGPGWSPSGEWFAWHEKTNYGGISTAHVVDKDGHAISILDDDYIEFMWWSPKEDKLLVMRRASGEQPFWYDAYIIDPQNPDQPIQIRDALQYNAPSYDYTDWTPDGRYVVQYSMDRMGDSRMEWAAVDGTVTTRDFYRPEINCGIPAWSSDGKVAYITADRNSFILENTIIGEMSRLQPPTGNIRRMVWSPDGKKLMVYTAADCSPSVTSPALWLVSDRDITRIEQAVTMPFSTRSYQALDLDEWSRDSHFVYFTTETGLRTLDALTRKITAVNIPGNGGPMGIDWLPDNHLAFIETAQYTLHGFDPVSQRVAPLLPENETFVSSFVASANGRAIAYVATGVFHIFNRATRQIADAKLWSDDSVDPVIRTIQWHPSADWLIVATGDVVGAVYVSSADSSVQRALTVCAWQASCFGWMPES